MSRTRRASGMGGVQRNGRRGGKRRCRRAIVKNIGRRGGNRGSKGSRREIAVDESIKETADSVEIQGTRPIIVSGT